MTINTIQTETCATKVVWKQDHAALQNKSPSATYENVLYSRISVCLFLRFSVNYKQQRTSSINLFIDSSITETFICERESKRITHMYNTQYFVCFFLHSCQRGQGDCSSNLSDSQAAELWRTRLSSDITDVRNHSSPGDALGDYMVHYQCLSMQSDEFISCCVQASATNHSSLYLVNGNGL